MGHGCRLLTPARCRLPTADPPFLNLAAGLMATTSSSSSSSAREFQLHKEVKRHEVSLDELSNLSSSRGVYHKNGNLFFRTTSEKAKSYEQKQLDSAKAQLDKIRSQA